jgi:hypothetical protein
MEDFRVSTPFYSTINSIEQKAKRPILTGIGLFYYPHLPLNSQVTAETSIS